MPKAAKRKTAKKKRRSSKPFAKPFRFGFLVHDVSRMRRTLFDQEMKPLGVTRSQWSVLATLSRGDGQDEGVTQVDLARRLEVGKVSIGGLIDRLQASGHVKRRTDPNDRRAKRIFITDKGYETIEKMQTVGQALNKTILVGVSAKDLVTTEETLAKVRANIRIAIENGNKDD